MASATATEIATVGGGCFWCLDALLGEVPGVQSIQSGYSGGDPARSDYKSVCQGDTGHAEVVQIKFDPEQLSFTELVQLFFVSHNPTTLNRQGNDVGSQYRSVIFYHDDQQQAEAQAVIDSLRADGVGVVTELSPYREFFVAEDYHQDYYRNNPSQPYCQVVIAPKLAKFRQNILDRSR